MDWFDHGEVLNWFCFCSWEEFFYCTGILGLRAGVWMFGFDCLIWSFGIFAVSWVSVLVSGYLGRVFAIYRCLGSSHWCLDA